MFSSLLSLALSLSLLLFLSLSSLSAVYYVTHIYYMTLGRLLNLFAPHFPYLTYNAKTNSTIAVRTYSISGFILTKLSTSTSKFFITGQSISTKNLEAKGHERPREIEEEREKHFHISLRNL